MDWRAFFSFSKGERRALLLIVCCVLLFVMEQYFSDNSSQPSEEQLVSTTEIDEFFEELHPQKSYTLNSRNSYLKKEKPLVELFAFNPNIADSIELLRLGLPTYVVRNTLKYRRAGGRFKTPDSFAKIYGLSPAKFKELEPYIVIPEQVLHKDTVRAEADTQTVKASPYLPIEKYAYGTKVDAAIADTTELKKIPGIGRTIARNIVMYRNKLGGFYTLSQLLEVEYFKPELLEWFVLDNVETKKININKAGIDKLRHHPYINFYQAKAIIEYRKERGKITDLSQLSLMDEFSDSDLERLKYYIAY